MLYPMYLSNVIMIVRLVPITLYLDSPIYCVPEVSLGGMRGNAKGIGFLEAV
jgi:hypothetical protein